MERMEKSVVHNSIPIDILDDLLTRFLIFVPEAAKENLIRICFQIELAHWFYLDFYVGSDPRLQHCSLYDFAAHVFQSVPELQGKSHNLREILNEWKEYKQCVPTYGAIILNEDMSHVLLVQSYWSRSSWSFPKGKVNEEEDPARCAIREVLEETGFDISPYIDPRNFLEATVNDQLVRLYIIKGVPLQTEFAPRTRCEIKACKWFKIEDLPNSKKDSTPKIKTGMAANNFYMVLPFVKRLKGMCFGGEFVPNRRNRLISASEFESAKREKSKSVSKADTDEKQARKKSQEKKHSKRKLFPDEGQIVIEGATFVPSERKIASNERRRRDIDSDDDVGLIEFKAPSWLNFKFDKVAIMECIP